MGRVISIFIVLLSFTVIVKAQRTAPVKVLKAQPNSISKIVEGHGIIKPLPSNDIKISSVSPSRIEKIFVKPGDYVKKGEPVIELQRDHALDLAVQKARIKLEHSKLNYKRAEKLFKSGVIAKVNLENANTEFKLAKSEFNLQLETQQYAVSNSEIRSPINGVVSSINGVIGQIADPSLDLIHIINMSKTIASIGIETEDMEKVKVGQKAEVTIPNVTDGKSFNGKVIKQNKEIDPSTQLVHIWIEIENAADKLQPGMFAEANIFVKTDSNVIVLPSSAVLTDSKGKYVFIIKDDIAHKFYVKTGIKNYDKVEIISGVQKGDLVVYLGNYELEDGMQVTIKN